MKHLTKKKAKEFFDAVKDNEIHTVKELIGEFPELLDLRRGGKSKTRGGGNALIIAVSYTHLEMVQCLFGLGVDVNSKYLPPLSMPVVFHAANLALSVNTPNTNGILDLFLNSATIDLHALDGDNCNIMQEVVLNYTISEDNTNVFEKLLEKGADIDYSQSPTVRTPRELVNKCTEGYSDELRETFSRFPKFK